MSIELQALRERRSIEDNKQFGRLAEKTQVLVPQNGLSEVPKNRATHSYEVATSSLVIAAYLAAENNLNMSDIDYQHCLYNVSILHDIGHPSFGHAAQKWLNRYFILKGLNDGFDDNNNNLVVIEKNGIIVRDYTKASVIKYPDKMYSEQVGIYMPILQAAIKMDQEHYSQFGLDLTNANRTMACELMDEADRNSYTFSDMSDFLCMGNRLNPDAVRKMAQNFHNVDIETLIEVATYGDKNTIKEYFSDLKEKLNCNYRFNRAGIEHIDENLMYLREFVNKLTMQFYIKPLRVLPFHLGNMEKLKVFVDQVMNNGFYPSKYYRDKIENATTHIEVLKAKRDMIGEMSDWYVINQYENFMADGKKMKDPEPSY